MKKETFEYLIRSVFAVKESEILCGEFFDLLPRFVDLQVSGQDAVTTLPQVGHHLHQCPECNEVYLALLQASQLEKESDPK
jgi:hypothetical protein